MRIECKHLNEEYNLSPNPVDISLFDNTFLECNIAHGMTFRSRRPGVIRNFTLDVDPGYNYIEKFRRGVQWCMMDTKDFVSSIGFKFKNENNKTVSFDGQSLTFRLSIKEN